MKPFRFKIVKRSIKVDLPSFPAQTSQDEPEQLTGMVQNKQASAPEERMAKALDEAKIQYIFRYTVGAPRGMPGWKELDFVVYSGGLIHAVEVDTAFTHRNKQQSDILHDAIVLGDQALKTMGEVYPTVMHVDGDADLADKDKANKFVQKNFTRGGQTIGRAIEYEAVASRIDTPAQIPASVIPQVDKVSATNKKKAFNKVLKTSPKNTAMSKKVSRYDKG